MKTPRSGGRSGERTVRPAVTSVDAVARAVLYEGYVLWPYRRSALKNRRRWTFGGVYPRAWSEAGHPDDAWRMETCCLVAVGPGARVRVRVRFLQVVRRGLERPAAGGGREQVDELEAGGERWLAWEEATERELDLGEHAVGELAGRPVERELAIAAGRQEETVGAGAEAAERAGGEARGNAGGAAGGGADDQAAGGPAGWVVRTWHGLSGRIVLAAEPVAGEDGLHRLSVAIENTTPYPGGGREAAVERALVSTHTLLTAGGGEFVSLADPPAELADEAEACRAACRGTWPVLAGDDGDRTTLFSSPILLEDYPRIAAESPGDLFDGGEIDQLLILNVLAMTDAEREEAAATDPKTREILERCAGLEPEDLLRLHGAMSDLGPLRGPATARRAPVGDARADGSAEFARARAHDDLPPSWGELNAPVEQSVVHGGVTLGPGSRVRLLPRQGGDVFDLALAGQVAIVEGVDQDHDGRVHLAVVLERDPGRDLGESRYPGHRFFFALDEVEPLAEEPAAGPRRRVLVAGIGNVFLGDDGFGVEVVRRLAERPQPPGVDVVDFGIRGMDLVYALARRYSAAILVDASPRGEPPGTVSVVEPELPDGAVATVETHGMDPLRVLALAAASGPLPETVRLVVCEPAEVPAAEDWHDATMELSAVVEAAVGPAIEQVEALVAEIVGGRRRDESSHAGTQQHRKAAAAAQREETP